LATLLQQRSSRAALLDRLRTLADTTVDLRYENPFDTALATYLIAIEQTVPSLVGLAAQLVINAKQTWLSSHLARSVLLTRRSLPRAQPGQNVVAISARFDRHPVRRDSSDSEIFMVTYLTGNRFIADFTVVAGSKPLEASIEEVMWPGSKLHFVGRSTAGSDERTLN
jgi:hypothetical protein